METCRCAMELAQVLHVQESSSDIEGHGRAHRQGAVHRPGADQGHSINAIDHAIHVDQSWWRVPGESRTCCFGTVHKEDQNRPSDRLSADAKRCLVKGVYAIFPMFPFLEEKMTEEPAIPPS
eukprot:312732-Amphidinium_carterae.1